MQPSSAERVFTRLLEVIWEPRSCISFLCPRVVTTHLVDESGRMNLSNMTPNYSTSLSMLEFTAELDKF